MERMFEQLGGVVNHVFSSKVFLFFAFFQAMRLCREEVNQFHWGALLSTFQKSTQWPRAVGLLPGESLQTTVSGSSVISCCGQAGSIPTDLCGTGEFHVELPEFSGFSLCQSTTVPEPLK